MLQQRPRAACQSPGQRALAAADSETRSRSFKKSRSETFNLRRSAPPLNMRVPGDSFGNHFKRKSKLFPGRRATRHGAAAAESRLSSNQREPFFLPVSRRPFRTLRDALLSPTMNAEDSDAGGAPRRTARRPQTEANRRTWGSQQLRGAIIQPPLDVCAASLLVEDGVSDDREDVR